MVNPAQELWLPMVQRSNTDRGERGGFSGSPLSNLARSVNPFGAGGQFHALIVELACSARMNGYLLGE